MRVNAPVPASSKATKKTLETGIIKNISKNMPMIIAKALIPKFL
jgi:hypothetical protein